ncbi:MAG: sugar phosphate isomerase/epimerase [Clostridia bacterium]|nr:sugar phosphate isomerase/epimerase [Clostridia bacterium]
MKLSTSTGDFRHYVDRISGEVACFKETKFRYINLEQDGNVPELLSEDDDDWRRFAHACGEAAAYANVKLVTSHAPCLRNVDLPVEMLEDSEDYRRNIRAFRRAIRVCHVLEIPQIVVHACTKTHFDEDTLYRYNQKLYGDLLDLAQECGILILTENMTEDAGHFTTGRQLRDFVDYVGHPMLGICWDTAHGNISPIAREIGQYQNILELGGKLQGLHIADNFGDCHHHTWPFAGTVNFDSVMHGLMDVGYGGYFNFEASYTLLHPQNAPYHRQPWVKDGKTVTTLLAPSIPLKQKAVDLMYDVGRHILEAYGCFEE